jgi:hypothetical protein
VGPDHEVDLPRRQAGEDSPPLRRPHPVSEQLHPHRARLEQRRAVVGHLDTVEQLPDAVCVLLGQHFGRRHEGPLVAALHGHEQGRDGDHRLAAPHVALQQPVHWMGGGQVVLDLLDGAALVVGQVERQPGHERVDERSVDPVGDALGGALDVALALDQRQLDPEQLVQHQPAARHVAMRHRVRGVDAGERLGPGDQVEPVEDPVGDGIEQAPHLRAPQRLGDPVAHLPGGQAGLLRLGVDGHDAAGPIADQVDHRVGHLLAAGVDLEFAEQCDGHPRPQLPLPPCLVEEADPQVPAAVGHVHGHQHLGRAPPGAPRRHSLHGHEDQRLLPHHQVADPRLVGAVHVAAWVVREQVQQALDADDRQPLGLALPDSLEPGDRHGRQLPQRDGCAVGGGRSLLPAHAASQRAARASLALSACGTLAQAYSMPNR